MKTTLDLPDALIKEVKLRALHDGAKLKDAVADLLRKGLDFKADTDIRADEAMLKRRKAITRKFISGEWGTELDSYESTREAERVKAQAKMESHGQTD